MYTVQRSSVLSSLPPSDIHTPLIGTASSPAQQMDICACWSSPSSARNRIETLTHLASFLLLSLLSPFAVSCSIVLHGQDQTKARHKPHLLYCQEHGTVPGPKPGKVGQEAIVEGQQTPLPVALGKTVQHALVLPCLVTYNACISLHTCSCRFCLPSSRCSATSNPCKVFHSRTQSACDDM